MGASNARGGIKNRDFRPISRFISETIQDMAIVTMECKYATVSSFQMIPFSKTLSDL